jgi:lysophospholipase L1-like esterase
VSASGSKVRIRLSNEEGTTPLILAAASVGLAGEGFVARAGSLRPLTFGGARSVTIPVGAPLLSDPVDLPMQAGAELLVSIHVPDPIIVEPRGGGQLALAAGDQTLRETLQAGAPIAARPFVTGATVLTGRATGVIATLGDSITDGNSRQTGEFRGWPGQLAHRLAARKLGQPFAVVNAGIGGNRILGPGFGPGALARLDRDVLRIDGLAYLIVLEGTNDIGTAGTPLPTGEISPLTAADLIAGYRQIIVRAHLRQVKVVIATIMPFGGAPSHSSPEKEALRQAVNHWIRTSHEPDGVIDFDVITRDPADPTTLLKAYDSGDHLHPGEAGYRAMGDAIDLAIFQ